MPLIYNKNLNQFIYDPSASQTIDELKNSPPLTNPLQIDQEMVPRDNQC